MSEEGTDLQVDPQVESQAREMGWRSKEEFRGDEAKWVDAATFVEKGEHVLPIVRATADRLRGDLTRTNSELASVRQALVESQKTIETLERYHQDDVKQKVEKAREKLKAELVAANQSGDHVAVADITEEMTRLNAAEVTAEANPPQKKSNGDGRPATVVDHTNHPEFIAWKNDNPWFLADPAKTALAYAATDRLRAAGDTRTGRAFLDAVSVEMANDVARLAGRPAPSKMEGGRGGAGSGNGGGGGGARAKTYADLPADAKAACDGYERDLVGPNRRYKDADAWRKSYTEQYFKDI